MNMRNYVVMAVAAMLMPACRSPKSTVVVAADSVTKSTNGRLAVEAFSTVENVIIDEWYFYPDTIVPASVMNDSTTMPKPKAGVLARRRVMHMRRNEALAMARDTVVRDAAVSRCTSSQTGSQGTADGVAVWLRVVLALLAVAGIAAIARMRVVN